MFSRRAGRTLLVSPPATVNARKLGCRESRGDVQRGARNSGWARLVSFVMRHKAQTEVLKANAGDIGRGLPCCGAARDAVRPDEVGGPRKPGAVHESCAVGGESRGGKMGNPRSGGQEEPCSWSLHQGVSISLSKFLMF